MESAIHGVLQAMDSIANVPASVTARLLQPAPSKSFVQSVPDLTPPKVVKRQRRLTLPLDVHAPETSGKAKWFSRVTPQRTFEQSQSALMRLPAELRKEIWRYVILSRTDRHFGVNDSVIEIGWRSTGSGRGRATAFKVSPLRDRDQWGVGVLGMLCSCRIIYSDAIDLLYSLPTFSFQNQNVETFLAFIGATLQHRRDQIRYLDLRWLSQPKSEVGPQTPEYKLNVKWSYRRISNIKALSELPDGKNFETDCAFVLPGWVIEDILESMKGLKKGGVNWGCESTGCFAQAS